MPTLNPFRGATNSWRQVVVADLVVVAVCAAGLAFVAPGNGNGTRRGWWIWWVCFYVVVVAPPYLVITKALGRHPRWRLVVLLLWVAFAIRTAWAVYQTFFWFMVSTW